MEIDDSTIISEQLDNPSDIYQNSIGSGFKMINLSSGVHTIDIDYGRNGNSGTASIWKSRIELWRVN